MIKPNTKEFYLLKLVELEYREAFKHITKAQEYLKRFKEVIK